MSAITVQALCEILPWDSEFFGFRIARVNRQRLDPDTLEEVMRWSAANEVRCLYFLADSGDSQTVYLAEEQGFHQVDVRVTLEWRPGSNANGVFPAAQSPTRPWREGDRIDLRAIARSAHRDSRFYYDCNFPAASCDALYETWIDRSMDGFANAVLVADLQGRAAGYVTCHLDPDQQGRIGLLAVASDSQGMRIGGRLIEGALQWFREHDVTVATITTQGRNCAAQRLYQRSGFVTRSLNLWYHRWFA